MAAIDKIYGNLEQYREFYNWLEQNKPEALEHLYLGWETDSEWQDGEEHPISNFPEWLDAWLLSHCPIGWVREQIRAQYGPAEGEGIEL